MKNHIFLIFCLVLFFGEQSQAGQPASFAGKIMLKQGVVETTHDVARRVSQPVAASEVVAGRYYRLLQFEQGSESAGKSALQAMGVRFLSYVPYNTWFVSIPSTMDASRIAVQEVRTLLPILSGYKMHKRVQEGSYPEYCIVAPGKVKLAVSCFADIPMEAIESGLKTAGISVVSPLNKMGVVEVLLPVQQVPVLCALPFVKFVEPSSPPAIPDDTKGRSLHRSNVINTPLVFGDHFNGDGVTISLADDGEVGPHIDFTGRITQLLSTGPGGNHGDMTSGIAVGAGNLDPTIRGMADGADILIHDINAGTNGYDHIYNCANYYSLYGAVITSTSYSQGCNDYNSITQSGDQLALDNPQMTFVFSAGNHAQTDCGYGAGVPWGTITGGFKIGKNPIACANLDAYEVLDNTSSHGPADDGRIKPDISSNGADQMSTDEGNLYQVGGGTSAACPGVAGVTAQLYQAYKNSYNGVQPDGALMKAVLLNTAQDIGNPGPDFTYGFGRINAYRALRTVQNGAFVLDSVAQGSSKTFTINVPSGVQLLKAMVYWADAPGDPAATFQLVNDIDLTVGAPGGSVYQPWVLDPTPNATSLSAPAIRGNDHLNNVEQVTIDSPMPGVYTVTVNGALIPSGTQRFYLTWDLVPQGVFLTYPFGGEAMVPGETELLRWDAEGVTSPFVLEYSIDAGVTWNPIVTLGATARQFEWTVPAVQTEQALIRVTSGSSSDASNAFFTILEQPQHLTVDFACPDTLQLSWNPSAGAVAYKIYRLGTKYMDEIATTAATSIQLAIPATGDEWFSVAPVGPIGSAGRRVNAIQKAPGLINCSLSLDMAAVQAVNPQSGPLFPCQNLTAVPLIINLRNDGLIDASGFTLSYTVNGGTPVVESYSGTLVHGASVNYTFATPLNLVTAGTYAVVIEVAQSGDMNMANNQLTLTLNSSPSGVLPLLEPFQNPVFPPAGWSIQASNATYQWALKQGITGSDGLSTSAAWFDDYSYNGAGAEDAMTTFSMDFSNTAYPELVFDVAYAVYGAGYDDGLRIEISSDCGATFQPTGYLKIGSTLASAPNSATDWYPTAASNWRKDTVDLSAFAGQQVILKFININDYGNNLLVDNINMIDNTLLSVTESDLKADLSVFPNPSAGIFRLVVEGLKDENINLTVRNAQGALVYSRPVQVHSGVMYQELDLSGFASGCYFGEVQTTEGSIPFKLIRM